MIEVFKRRVVYEEYLNNLKSQMAGKDRNEFSNYPILQKNYTVLLDKFKKFPTELDKDYQGFIEKLRHKYSEMMKLSAVHFIYKY